MTEDKRGSWRWKVKEPIANRGLRLKYEPGNWGDVLKGVWAVLTVETAVRARSLDVLRYLDPFAGAPVYPLVDAARKRFEELAGERLARLQHPFVREGTIASTALLVREAARELGATARLSVFDADPARLAAWGEVKEAAPLSITSGDEALASPGAQDLILVDPYDFFDRHAELIPLVLEASRACPVLVYLFNRAPRGGGHERTYRTLRAALDRRRAEESGLLVGRLPSDAVLPRAYHEMLLVGPRAFVEAARAPLEAATRALSSAVTAAGAFEAH